MEHITTPAETEPSETSEQLDENVLADVDEIADVEPGDAE
jgi:hypothetical protein